VFCIENKQIQLRSVDLLINGRRMIQFFSVVSPPRWNYVIVLSVCPCVILWAGLLTNALTGVDQTW